MSILSRTRSLATRPNRVSPVNPLPFGHGIDLTPRLGAYGPATAPLPRKANSKPGKLAPITRAEHRPAAPPFRPDPLDRAWAENAVRDVFEMEPALPFWGRLQAMGRQLRDRGDEVGTFLAAEIERLVTLASLIGATGPDDFDAKRDQAETDARGTWEARGYELGFAEGLIDGAPFSGPMD